MLRRLAAGDRKVARAVSVHGEVRLIMDPHLLGATRDAGQWEEEGALKPSAQSSGLWPVSVLGQHLHERCPG